MLALIHLTRLRLTWIRLLNWIHLAWKRLANHRLAWIWRDRRLTRQPLSGELLTRHWLTRLTGNLLDGERLPWLTRYLAWERLSRLPGLDRLAWIHLSRVRLPGIDLSGLQRILRLRRDVPRLLP